MLDLFSLESKIALVTGASRGLGQALAIALAAAGAEVICSSSKQGGTQDTIQKIKNDGGQAIEISANLSDREQINSLYTKAIDKKGKVDILVNNGGTIARYPAIDYPIEEWDRVLQVNLTAAFILAKKCANSMMESGGGKIINIASMLSYSGGITVPAYTASKHGIAGLTKALANEWASHNIQVNAIAPGYFKTDNTLQLQNNPERNQEIIKRIPAQKWGVPSDLSGAIIFLASGASNYINGTLLNVDGGWMSR